MKNLFSLQKASLSRISAVKILSLLIPEKFLLSKIELSLFIFSEEFYTGGVVEYQIIQHSKNSVEIKLVKGAGYTKEKEKKIIEDFREKYGFKKVQVTYTERIERTGGGKLKSFIQDAKNGSKNI